MNFKNSTEIVEYYYRDLCYSYDRSNDGQAELALVEDLSAKAMLEAIEIIEAGNFHFTKQESGGNVFSALTYSKYLRVKKHLKKIR